MTKAQRFFTLEEVNALIPKIEACLGKIIEKKARYASRHDTLFMHEIITAAEKEGGIVEQDQGNMDEEFQDLETALEEIREDIEAISSLGGRVRDIEQGLVDFYGKVGEETVFFAWKLGEKTVEHYRNLNDEGKERRPLSERKSA